jgi:hypothetical protein
MPSTLRRFVAFRTSRYTATLARSPSIHFFSARTSRLKNGGTRPVKSGRRSMGA